VTAEPIFRPTRDRGSGDSSLNAKPIRRQPPPRADYSPAGMREPGHGSKRPARKESGIIRTMTTRPGPRRGHYRRFYSGGSAALRGRTPHSQRQRGQRAGGVCSVVPAAPPIENATRSLQHRGGRRGRSGRSTVPQAFSAGLHRRIRLALRHVSRGEPSSSPASRPERWPWRVPHAVLVRRGRARDLVDVMVVVMAAVPGSNSSWPAACLGESSRTSNIYDRKQVPKEIQQRQAGHIPARAGFADQEPT